VNHGSQITNERQARELAKTPVERRAEVLEIAGVSASGDFSCSRALTRVQVRKSKLVER
jgi:hypothetical protein